MEDVKQTFKCLGNFYKKHYNYNGFFTNCFHITYAKLRYNLLYFCALKYDKCNMS